MNTDSVLRILIADDEEHARLRIRDLLSAQTQAVSIFEAENGNVAVEAIRRAQPDLLFLDVQMPGMDGFEVIRAIGPEAVPITVFVTAFETYAVRAFEENALDYLQKPFSDDRFERTFARAMQRLKETEERNFGFKIATMLASIKGNTPYIDRIAVRSSGSIRFVTVKQIDWIEADGVYVTIHAGEVSLLHRAALAELERQLDPQQFVRVHRAALINIDSAVRLNQRSHGEFDLFLRNGAQIKVSRLYRSRLEERLRQDL